MQLPVCRSHTVRYSVNISIKERLGQIEKRLSLTWERPWKSRRASLEIIWAMKERWAFDDEEEGSFEVVVEVESAAAAMEGET